MATNLDLYQLRAFHALVQAGGFTQAARRLNVTQSAVSHALARLEASAGVALVRRGVRGARPTPEGQRLFAACEEVFATLEAAQEDLAGGPGPARLRIGATVEFGATILVKHIGPFLARHPEIHVDFHLGHELLEPLLRDDLDLAIDCREHLHPELAAAPLFRESYVVACAPALAAALASPADLAALPLLSLDRAGAWWRRFLLALPDPERPDLGPFIEVDHIRAMINAAAAGLGVVLAPKYAVLDELARGDLRLCLPAIRPLEDRFHLYQKRRRSRLRAHHLLTDYLATIAPAEFGS